MFTIALFILSLVDCAPHRMRKAVGEEFTIDLVSNPSTGYSWYIKDYDKEAKHDNDAVVLVNEKFLSSYEASTLDGSPSKQLFTFLARANGEQTLVLEYKRAWETVEPLKTESYIIVVQ
ncbi:putative inhibitor of cysteine peptidase [Blattamonas nauphoetae]|uniref:Inhibitor of cysteine peptidase n=1 Tax=Blattamonas nauphoetae TaxID=2049346 RepID=A0ABQ9Y9L1_9EUKA|nr:putative inhibitor of cysteine peptidase [Blattamonas nauphoetae]